MDDWVALVNRLAVTSGGLITDVAGDSLAIQAGIQPGDVIVGFGGREITNNEELVKAIHDSSIGQPVAIAFWRSDNRQTTTATLIESPSPY